MGQIAPESKKFLVFLFTDLRDDLASQVGTKGSPSPEAIARQQAIYDALLTGLADERELSDDELLREYVVGLAEATDQENRYEQAVLEHRAFAELIKALSAQSSVDSEAAAVDWNGLLTALLHPTQFQIIEAMHWIGRPVSASQLIQVFGLDLRDLSAMSYHFRRLSELRIVKLSWVKKMRGAKERFYKLSTAEDAI